MLQCFFAKSSAIKLMRCPVKSYIHYCTSKCEAQFTHCINFNNLPIEIDKQLRKGNSVTTFQQEMLFSEQIRKTKTQICEGMIIGNQLENESQQLNHYTLNVWTKYFTFITNVGLSQTGRIPTSSSLLPTTQNLIAHLPPYPISTKIHIISDSRNNF